MLQVLCTVTASHLCPHAHYVPSFLVHYKPIMYSKAIMSFKEWAGDAFDLCTLIIMSDDSENKFRCRSKPNCTVKMQLCWVLILP